jgi:hypothetical protein
MGRPKVVNVRMKSEEHAKEAACPLASAIASYLVTETAHEYIRISRYGLIVAPLWPMRLSKNVCVCSGQALEELYSMIAESKAPAVSIQPKRRQPHRGSSLTPIVIMMLKQIV